jgi:hypothetical protein
MVLRTLTERSHRTATGHGRAWVLKHVTYLRDTAGRDVALRYLRTKDGKEVDFSLVEDGLPRERIEGKLASAASARPRRVMAVARHRRSIVEPLAA